MNEEQANLPAAAAEPLVRIRPVSGWCGVNWKELREYHELLFFLVWRDISVRYKQTVIGAAWAIIQPFFTMLVFSLFFGKLAKIPTGGIAYPVFSYAALVPWTFFANSMAAAGNSLVNDQNLVQKIYFPRLILPTSAVLGGAADFALAFAVLLAMALGYGHVPTANLAFLPLLLLLALATALGTGLWLAALNAQFRDIRYVIPFLAQLWMFCTPIAYPTELVPETWRPVYGLNPMAGVVDGFRWALLGTGEFPGTVLAASAPVAAALLLSGVYYFRRMERVFADVI